MTQDNTKRAPTAGRDHASGAPRLTWPLFAWVEPWLPAILFALLISLIAPWWSIYEFDTDEGINLAKADLVAAGFHPYTDIWNDQPPLLTYALVVIKTSLGDGIVWARGFMLLCAGVILRTLFTIVRAAYGRPAAWMAVALLATSAAFGRLSVSVMVGLPAIAMALLAMEVLLRARGPVALAAVGAGVLFALSLQIKFFTFMAGPAMLVAIALSPRLASWWGRLGNAVLFVVCTLAVFLAISVLAGQPIIDQLFVPHIQTEVRAAGSLGSSFGKVLGQLAQSFWILLLGLAGGVWACRRRERTGIALLVWFAIAWAALSPHWPIWYHHTLMMTVPLSGLAGIWAEKMRVDWLPALQQRYRRLAVAVACITLLLSFVIAHPRDLTPEGASIATTLARNAGANGWVVTDHLMDAYYAGLLVPPELVVFSYKRRLAGNLGADTIIDALKAREPSQILFRRFSIPKPLAAYLAEHYVPSKEIADRTYFRRRPSSPDRPSSTGGAR